MNHDWNARIFSFNLSLGCSYFLEWKARPQELRLAFLGWNSLKVCTMCGVFPKSCQNYQDRHRIQESLFFIPYVSWKFLIISKSILLKNQIWNQKTIVIENTSTESDDARLEKQCKLLLICSSACWVGISCLEIWLFQIWLFPLFRSKKNQVEYPILNQKTIVHENTSQKNSSR